MPSPHLPPPLPAARTVLLGAATTLVVSLVGAPPPSSALPVAAARAAVTEKHCISPRPAKPATTPFGVSLSPAPTLADDRRVEQKRFGRLKVVRIFDPSIPPSNAWQRRKTQLRGLQIATSFRMPPADVLAGVYDAQLRHFFKTAPTKRDVFWTYYHEPEADIDNGVFTARQYRRAWRHIAEIAGTFCRPRLFPTLVLTGWTAETASGRSLDTYFPGRRYISVLAWDPYNQAVGTPTEYRPVGEVFGPAVKVSRAAKLPFAVTETGTARVSGDGGAGRAKWISRMGAYLRKHRALFVTYFQSTYMGDFELRDTPSVRAYKRFVQS